MALCSTMIIGSVMNALFFFSRSLWIKESAKCINGNEKNVVANDAESRKV